MAVIDEWRALLSARTEKPDDTWLLVIGDPDGIARAWTYTGREAAQRCENEAQAYLGREWAGGFREITVAQVFEAVGGRWEFRGEWEY